MAKTVKKPVSCPACGGRLEKVTVRNQSQLKCHSCDERVTDEFEKLSHKIKQMIEKYPKDIFQIVYTDEEGKKMSRKSDQLKDKEFDLGGKWIVNIDNNGYCKVEEKPRNLNFSKDSSDQLKTKLKSDKYSKEQKADMKEILTKRGVKESMITTFNEFINESIKEKYLIDDDEMSILFHDQEDFNEFFYRLSLYPLNPFYIEESKIIFNDKNDYELALDIIESITKYNSDANPYDMDDYPDEV